MNIEETPCPACGETALRIQWKLKSKPIGSFSLSGGQMKTVVRPWPYLICDKCGIEAEGVKDAENMT